MLKRIVPVLGFLAVIGMVAPTAAEACDYFKRLRARRSCNVQYTQSYSNSYCQPQRTVYYYYPSYSCQPSYYSYPSSSQPVAPAPESPAAPEAPVAPETPEVPELKDLPQRNEGPTLRDLPSRNSYEGLNLRNLPGRNN